MDFVKLQKPQIYSVTLSLPNEFHSELEQIVTNYLKVIKERKLQYIQCYEYNKKGVKHAHLMYEAEDQKSTSNETKKFKECYSFSKKEWPKAISHHKHDNKAISIGYCQKDPAEPVTTNFSDEELKFGLDAYNSQLVSKKPKDKNNFMTVNQIATEIVNYIQKNITIYYEDIQFNIDRPIDSWFKANLKTISFTTYQRINKQKLYEYVRYGVDISDYFI